MTDNTKQIIDEVMIHAQGKHNSFYEGLQDGTIDRRKYTALARRLIIKAIHFQFKKGLELSDIGCVISPEAMIDLIHNYNDQGEKLKQEITLNALDLKTLPTLAEHLATIGWVIHKYEVEGENVVTMTIVQKEPEPDGEEAEF